MWHASAAPREGYLGREDLRALALAALKGVGDADLGQWEEQGQRAYHVRRRLTAREQQPIGDALDVRGTVEALARITRARKWMLAPIAAFAEREVMPA